MVHMAQKLSTGCRTLHYPPSQASKHTQKATKTKPKLEEKQQTLIDDFRFHLDRLSIFPYFHEYIPNLKYYAHFYYGLLFRLVEKGTLTASDMTEAVKLAEEKQVYNKDLKFKFELIEAYLKNKL